MKAASRPEPARIEALFEALADLAPEEARRRLDDECAGDPVLRASVEELLAHDRTAARGFLEPPRALLEEALCERAGNADTVPAGGSATVTGSGDAGGADAELPAGSSRLGRFYVLKKLGEGGMGLVYIGYDEGLDRRVALKVLRRGTAAREWLLREGQALGRLSHPNVVAIHEVSEHEGRVFLAMELVEGPTLHAWLAERPRSFSETLRLFLEAGRGLAAAHEAGLVHRDFKPDNVLVGKDGRARVVDFGIASLADGAPEELPAAPDLRTSALASPLTQKGALMGTPAFMSPEQFRGERATPASDQWSFSVAFYRAAYGVSPYPSSDFYQLASSVIHDAPASPPRRPEVPAWLAPILLRALEREPSARFPSMSDLLAAIEEHVPRDPELDPTIVVRERQILSAYYFASVLTVSCLMLSDACARVLIRPPWLLGVPAGMLALVLSVIAIRWRQLSQNRYGRRLAGLFPAGAVALLLNRLIALRLGLPPTLILVEDLVVMATFYGVIAHMDDRWVGWLAAISALAAIASSLAPEHSPAAFGAAGVVGVAAMIVRLFIDRHMRPESAVGLQETTAKRAPPTSGATHERK